MKLPKTQCVYVIYNPELNITKIGISDNVEKRRDALQTMCGCELLIHYYSPHIIEANKYESLAHNKLAHKRRVGEWFNVTPEEAEDVVKGFVGGAKRDPIIKAYVDRESISKIAKDNGVSRQAILSKLRECGFYGNIDGYMINITDEKPKETTHALPCEKIIENPAFLDTHKPMIPLKNLKRHEPNINFNGEWYQASVFYKGQFYYAYTRDINKARDYVKTIKGQLTNAS